MQLSDLCNHVRERVGINHIDQAATNSALAGLLNSAVRELNLMADWDWMKVEVPITTTAGVFSYTPPADWRSTVRIESPSGAPLELRAPADARRLLTHSGSPRIYVVERGRIGLFPVPNGVLTLNHVYIATEPDLVVDADTPRCPRWMIDAVIVKAARKLCTRINNRDLLRQLQEEEAIIMAGIRDEARRSRATLRVRARRDWS